MPKSIPYEDQLSSNSESQPIRLCDYLKEMRNYSQIVREWLLTTPGSTYRLIRLLTITDATYFLTRFGGLNSEYPYQIPRYVFDNQVTYPPISVADFFKLLSSKERVSSTLSSPFAKETSKVEDVPNRLYDDIIQATYDHLHSHSSTSSYEPHTSFNYTVTKQFYLGPPLSGAPFHAHGPAYNALL